MGRSRWLLALSFVVVSSMLAWACGGGGGEKQGTATPPAATGPAGQTPQAGGTAQAGASLFADVSARFAQATFKATYEIKSTGGPQDVSWTMTLCKKGDNWREDIETESDGKKSTSTYISTPAESYRCTPTQPGVTDTCVAAPTLPGEGPSQAFADLQKTLTSPDVQVVSTSSRNIAGEDADCYTIHAAEFEGDAEICLSKDAVPLSSKSTAEGVESTLETIAFSRDVPDSDFQPPYPVTETGATAVP
jgi:hypothetical protein